MTMEPETGRVDGWDQDASEKLGHRVISLVNYSKSKTTSWWCFCLANRNLTCPQSVVSLSLLGYARSLAMIKRSYTNFPTKAEILFPINIHRSY